MEVMSELIKKYEGIKSRAIQSSKSDLISESARKVFIHQAEEADEIVANLKFTEERSNILSRVIEVVGKYDPYYQEDTAPTDTEIIEDVRKVVGDAEELYEKYLMGDDINYKWDR